MEGFSLERVLIDGALFTFALTVLVLGSLTYNPRLWLHDYPEEIRVLQAPLTNGERRTRNILVVLMLTILGGLFVSSFQLKAANGGTIPFLTAFTHVYLIFNIFNLFDAVVIDWFILMVLKPRFMLLPDVDSWMPVFHNPSLHITNYLKGVIGGVVLAGIIALITVIL